MVASRIIPEPHGREPDLCGISTSDGAVLPPAIAFLAGSVDAALLRRIASTAERIGMAADIVLLNEGHMGAEAYYRRLARHLELPFAERPLRLGTDVGIEQVLHRGFGALQPNPAGWRHIAAPRGAALDDFIAKVRGHPDPAALQIVLTLPDRLEAMARADRRASVVHAASHGLPEWNGALSARDGLSAGQAVLLALVSAALCASAWLDPHACLMLIRIVFVIGFAMIVGLRLVTTAVVLQQRREPSSPDRVSDRDLPVYSVVVPLYRERRVVEPLVRSLDVLDYPAAKLDVILMVEANDVATLAEIERLRLPGRYRTIMASPGHPQTKPRALNIALRFARGALLVVYDAEDEPEPDQLRLAVAAFKADRRVVCLQAKLAIDNSADNWLTRLFAIEYAALFDVINPGLAALGLPVPLGGTSNHFRIGALRRLQGWDAWNVTEDIDLGIRLARFGCVVRTLESTTLEEAPNRVRPWLAQRRRWLKGWVVTFATHSRNPAQLYRDLGLWRLLAVFTLLFGTMASCLLGPFFAVSVLLRFWSGLLLHPQTLGDGLWSAACLGLLSFGAASAILPAVLALHRRGALASAGWLILLPAYLSLLSWAAWPAVFEACGRPFTWAKTEHGHAKRRSGTHPPG